MRKLVIVTKEVLETGRIYRGLELGPWFEPEPNQCFRVVAPDTERGWVDCLVDFHGENERSWFEMVTAINGPWNYYEIQTD